MSKRIATVDGISNGIINCTISMESRGTPVQGSFAQIMLENDQHWLVRVNDVSLENPIHQNNQFAPLIMDRGFVPEWSGLTDIERAKAEVVSIIDNEGNHIPRDRNCPSGTPITEIDESAVHRFMREKEYHAFIGKIANSNIYASVINRDFSDFSAGDKDRGGYGEARHVAIFGRNGSGKSVWVLVLLTVKLAAHKDMGLIIPDTQGDFEDSTKHSRGSFQWDYKEALREAGVEVETIPVADIAMKSKEALKDVLSKCFLTIYSTDGNKSATLAKYVVDNMFEKTVDAQKITAERIANEVCEQIGACYAKSSRAEKIEDANNVLNNPGRMRGLESYIESKVLPFFTGKQDIRDLVKDVLSKKRKVVIGMNHMPEYQQMYVMKDLMKMLKNESMRRFKGKNERSNAIVVLDEAPRWLPQSESPEIKEVVSQALKETRKTGVGWWVVGQSPADVDKSVLRQSHMTWLGRGLGVGADEKHVKETLQEGGYQAYMEMQRRPGRYFWVGVGLDNNIGHDNTHIAVEPFDGDSTQKLIDANPHIWTKEPRI